MYNRYIPNGDSYTRIPMEDAPAPEPPPARPPDPPEPPPPARKEPGSGQQAAKGLSGLLKGLKLDSLDAGDVLLLLILLFLALEGDDNLELLITLGLILLLGLD